MMARTCPVGWVRVLLAALDSLHSICQCCTSLGPIEQGSVECMDKNLGSCNRDRPQGDKNTLCTSSQEGSGQSYDTVCSDLAAGLLVRPVATMTEKTHTLIHVNSTTAYKLRISKENMMIKIKSVLTISNVNSLHTPTPPA